MEIALGPHTLCFHDRVNICLAASDHRGSRRARIRVQSPTALLAAQRCPGALPHQRSSAGCGSRDVAAAAGRKSGKPAKTKGGGGRGGGIRKEEQSVTDAVTSPTRATASSTKEPLLVVEGISKSHDGDTQLFKDVSFTISRGDRLAFVGPNGSGKSTLLKIMAGADEPDTGTIKRIGATRIGYLQQEPIIDPEQTVLEAVLSSDSEGARAVQDYDRTLEEFQAGTASQEALDAAHKQVDHYNGWLLDSEARIALEELGCLDVHAKIGNLSGGQRRRAALAAALMSAPDLLILDEPTNHLDLQAIQWAEARLSARDATLALVSHDRAFLEALATGFLELDRDGTHFHSVSGPGCYSKFREAREARRHAAAQTAQAARVVLRKESAWMAKQPKARQAKSKSRQDNYLELLATSRSGPRLEAAVDFGSSSHMSRLGNKVLRIEGCSAAAGSNEVVRDFWYEFDKGDRIGIVGPNGSGKSTLLNMLAGINPPTAGERSVGDTTVTGYFTQQPIDMRADFRIIDWITHEVKVAPQLETEGPAITPEMLLERLGFPRSEQHREVGLLSGGQRRRLQLAGVLRMRPNLLLLDEATNDLDLSTIEAVEGLLAEFKGVLCVVSHDRAFLEATADRLFVLQGDGLVRLFEGTYSEYLEVERKAAQKQRRAERQKGSTAGAAPVPQTKAAPERLRLSYRESQELLKLEDEVSDLSDKRAALDALIARSAEAGDFEQLTEATQNQAQLVSALEQKEERWMLLADKAPFAHN